MDVANSILGFLIASSMTTAVHNVNAQEAPSHEEIEIIEVVGEVDEHGYKKRIIKAKKDFYVLYNKMTQDSMLKVNCKKEIKPGSGRIRITVCEPAYEARITPRYMTLADALLQLPDPIREKKVKQYKNKQLEHLVVLVNSDEELKDKFLNYVELTNRYKAKRAE